MLFKRLALVFVLFSLPFIAQAQVAPTPQTLTPEQPVERQIAGGESHTFQITLTAGQFVRVVVEQRIIGVVLKFAAPDGKQLLEVDITSAGELESLSAEAAMTGMHQLTISGNGPLRHRRSSGQNDPRR